MGQKQLVDSIFLNSMHSCRRIYMGKRIEPYADGGNGADNDILGNRKRETCQSDISAQLAFVDGI